MMLRSEYSQGHLVNVNRSELEIKPERDFIENFVNILTELL